MRVKGCLVLLVALVLMMPLLSEGAEVQLTSSTQYLWYQDILADRRQEDVAQYMRFNVTKLDQAGNLNIYGYGRATKQTTTMTVRMRAMATSYPRLSSARASDDVKESGGRGDTPGGATEGPPR